MTLDLLAVVKQAVREVLREEGFVPQQAETGERISLDAAARLVGVSKKTVRRWIADGYLPTYGTGRLVRVAPDEVRACLTRKKLPPSRFDEGKRLQELLASAGVGR